MERALKKAILHRKNSLFYKTTHGAEVGDLFMGLIHTCELNDANPFEYLIELQRHAPELAKNAAAWMPWNYQQSLQPASTGGDPLRSRLEYNASPWPQTIDLGQAGAQLENGRKTGFPKSEIAKGFWPPLKAAFDEAPGGLYARVST